MAIKALNLISTRIFTSRYDAADSFEDKTKFTIGALDSRIVSMLRDKGTTVTVNTAKKDDEVDSQINMNIVNFEACVYGLRHVENLKDNDGNDVVMRKLKRNHAGVSYEVCDPQVVALIPQDVIQELGEEILKDNELSARDVKN